MKKNIFLLLFGPLVYAQTTHQSLYWYRFFDQLKINERFELHTEIEQRRFYETHAKSQYINHLRLVGAATEQVNFAAGYAFFIAYGSGVPVPEHRPYIDAAVSNGLGHGWGISQRLRFEERFFRPAHSPFKTERLRYRLAVQKSLPHSLRLKASTEVLVNHGKSIVYNQFDQSQSLVGLEKFFSKNWGLEANYVHQFQKRNAPNTYRNTDVSRLTVIHRWGRP